MNKTKKIVKTKQNLKEGIFDFMKRKDPSKSLREKLNEILNTLDNLKPVPNVPINPEMVRLASENIVKIISINRMVASDPEISKVWNGVPEIEIDRHGILRDENSVNVDTIWLGGIYGIFTKTAREWIASEDAPKKGFDSTKSIVGSQLSNFVNMNLEYGIKQLKQALNNLHESTDVKNKMIDKAQKTKILMENFSKYLNESDHSNSAHMDGKSKKTLKSERKQINENINMLDKYTHKSAIIRDIKILISDLKAERAKPRETRTIERNTIDDAVSSLSEAIIEMDAVSENTLEWEYVYRTRNRYGLKFVYSPLNKVYYDLWTKYDDDGMHEIQVDTLVINGKTYKKNECVATIVRDYIKSVLR